jgi:hypothetical protein
MLAAARFSAAFPVFAFACDANTEGQKPANDPSQGVTCWMGAWTILLMKIPREPTDSLRRAGTVVISVILLSTVTHAKRVPHRFASSPVVGWPLRIGPNAPRIEGAGSFARASSGIVIKQYSV